MKKKVFAIAFVTVIALCSLVALSGCRKKGPLEKAGEKTDEFGKDMVKGVKKLGK
jgi:predicted small lipoprotein YifL